MKTKKYFPTYRVLFSVTDRKVEHTSEKEVSALNEIDVLNELKKHFRKYRLAYNLSAKFEISIKRLRYIGESSVRGIE